MPTSKYPNGIKINLNQCGKVAIEHLVKAYGFTTRQALADHLGVSKSTLANRYMKDKFPADWIIQCELATGVSLRWLSTSDDPMRLDARTQVVSSNKIKIIDAKLIDSNHILFDTTLLPCNVENISAVEYENSTNLIRQDVNEVNDSKWVVSISGLYSIRELTRPPNNRVMVESKSSKIECSIEVIGKMILTCK
ncbi:phage repressor protein CI [Klebsiella variicola]